MPTTALIFNVNGRDSTYGPGGVDAETAGGGAWDPGGGANDLYFPAIYTSDFTPVGTVGVFLGHWPDGIGGKDSAIKVNKGFIGSWVIAYQEQYSLAGGTPSVDPSDGIVLSAVSGQAQIIVYEDTDARIKLGYLSAGVYGIRVVDTGSNIILEASDTRQVLGGWNFDATTLSAANITFLSGANPLITVGVDANWKIKIGGTAGSEYLGSSTFTSGPLGVGWKIDSTTARAEFQDIVARGKLSMAVFEYQTISAVGGLLMVSGADVMAVDMTAADASTLTIDGDVTFYANDILRIKDGVDDEWLRVIPGETPPTYAVTRDLAGSYGANANPIWKKGTAVVSTGGTGSGAAGYILLDAASANSPYMDIVLRNSVTYNDLTTKVRIGNLDGIGDTDFGIAPSGYGLYTDNVFLKGSIITAAPGNKRITINEYEDGAFNNAMLFYDGADVVIRIDDSVISGHPGILITDGVIYQSSSVTAWAAQFHLSEPDVATTSWAVEADYNSTSLDNHAKSRIGLIARSTIGHDNSNSPAYGIITSGSTMGGSGAAYGIHATAFSSGAGTKYGIFATAIGTGTTWAGYFDDGDVYIKENLGIGTTPSVKFDVADSATSNGAIAHFYRAVTDGNLVNLFLGKSAAAGGTSIFQFHPHVGTPANSYLAMGIWGDNVGAGVGLVIKKGGNVGINEPAPDEKLEVNGVIKSTAGGFQIKHTIAGQFRGMLALDDDGVFISQILFAESNGNIYIDAGPTGAAGQVVIRRERDGAGGTTAIFDSSGSVIMLGDTYWTGDGSGLPYGSMYNNNVSTTVTIGFASTFVRIPSGFSSTQNNLATFGNSREITVTKAGRYLINWSISFYTASGTNQNIEGSIGINNSEINPGTAHRFISTNQDIGNIAGTAILDLAASAVVSLMMANNTNTVNIVVNHANLTLVMVGGT